jgi:hypothetical protein
MKPVSMGLLGRKGHVTLICLDKGNVDINKSGYMDNEHNEGHARS